MKYRKKPIVIEATQWFRNGDHPKDDTRSTYSDFITEGKVVRRFRRPDTVEGCLCDFCDNPMHDHGWIDTLEGGHIVCPCDWIITGIEGEYYPCKPSVFEKTYEPVV